MNKISKFSALLAITATFIFSSCKNDEDIKVETENYKGIFVINEGGFGKSNGSVGLYKPGDKTYFDAFKKANDRPLGDIVQSFASIGDYFYIVVNNSNKVEIVSKSDFKSAATILSPSPRYIISTTADKAYMSNLMSNTIKVLNTGSKTIVSQIDIHHSSEQMAKMNNKVFVATFDNKIMVINSEIDSLSDSIVTPSGLSKLINAGTGKLGALCTGLVDFNTGNVLENGKILIINDSNKIEKSVSLSSGSYGGSMVYSPSTQKFYFSLGNNTIYAMDMSGSITTFVTLEAGRSVYGLTYDSDSDLIYVTDAVDFNSAGKVIVYDLSASKTNEFNAGIAPNAVYFHP